MGRVGVGRVLAWAPGVAVEASAGVAEADSRLVAAVRRVGRLVDVTVAGWQGAAGTAAVLRAVQQQWAADHLGAAMLVLTEALTEAATLEQVCTLVREIQQEALACGCVIADDGTVSAPRSRTGHAVLDLVLSAGFEARARTLQARLVALLDTAGRTDETVGARLAQTVVQLNELETNPAGGELDSRVDAILEGTATLPEDPAALYAFWKSLAPADRDALAAYDPYLGDRDGIPARTRDHYNRLAMERLRTGADSALRRLTAQHPDWAVGDNLPDTSHDWLRLRDWDAARQRERTRLAEYSALAEQIGTGGSTRLLLAVDGDGHGAVAVGDPDSACNAATYVPGTGSALTGIGSGVARAQRLLDAAVRADPAARTAVIAWYGYDAPPDLRAASSRRRAGAGAPALDRFEAGLRATHGGIAARQTVLGHSYGSTLIGAAASSGRSLSADAVVFLGSPGVGVHDVSELRLTGIPFQRNGEHVFATADPADPVPVLGPFVHGMNPVAREFGATVFASAGATVDLPILRAVPADVWSHGNYWEPGNPALWTQGEIVTGRFRR